MPTNPRALIKQDLDRAVGHIETIQEYLVRCGELYRPSHPEISAQYETVYAYFEEGKQIIIALRNAY